MAAFQAKTDWKTLKKTENKNYRFVSFLPGAEQKMKKKKSKKIKKIKKQLYGFISSQNMFEKAEKERKKK